MDDLAALFIIKYNNLININSSNYLKVDSKYPKNNNKIYKMSAAITPQGIITEQTPAESIDDLEEKLKGVHPDYQGPIKDGLTIGFEIGSIYNRWINSYEGQEYIKFAKAKGKGSARPGIVDDIRTISAGAGLVAATTPESLRKQIYINKDFVYDYAVMLSNAVGISFDQAIEVALVHELGHNDIQGPYDRRGSEKQIEYHNDNSFVEFYTGLAKKDLNNSDTHLKKAKAFTVRYDGKERKNMDTLIMNTEKEISKSYVASNENYRQAA